MIRSAEKNGERTDTMEKSDIRYQAYVSILEEELKPGVMHICPKDSEHSIINTGDKDLVMLTIVVKR